LIIKLYVIVIKFIIIINNEIIYYNNKIQINFDNLFIEYNIKIINVFWYFLFLIKFKFKILKFLYCLYEKNFNINSSILIIPYNNKININQLLFINYFQ